ncbi:MAG: alanine racemase [Candidatus Omnitrophica bacterium]|nr:alanine racemase [Candidatus Omnitrophota bacterium]
MKQIIEKELGKDFGRPTWAEVDLVTLGFNLDQIRKWISPEVKIMPIVKADAYGHGIVEVSRYLIAQGIDYLGVATIDEAVVLREKRINIPILVLGSILPHETPIFAEYNITPTITNFEVASHLNKVAAEKNRHIKVHVKIDTGMGRIGIWHEEAMEFFLKIRQFKNLELAGLWTHFASAEDSAFTELQLARFNFVLGGLKQLGFNFTYIHSANSTAVFKNRNSHFNLIRPGLVLYGVYPDISLREIADLKPVMSLKTRIVFLKKILPGHSVSYSRTFVAERKSLIATLPLGYGDGYSWLLSNRGKVIVKGKRASIVGRVCMDQTMIDVTDIEGVNLGDEVILIGRQDKERVTVEELASLSETIPYEILCRISSRIPRIYKF